MTTALREAFRVARELPVQQQDEVAAWMLEEIESERRWQELFEDPRSQSLLRQMAGAALEEHRRGETWLMELDRP